jgi:Ca-activated chloride channel homolog
VTHVTWEQPSALWLLLAILLLLFARSTTPRQRITVANLFLWADLESRPASALSRRLRQHWLLLLQAAFVAVVVTTLARPLISLDGQHIAIVLDVSMSMGAKDGSGTRLETAKARVSSLVHDLPRGGRATIWLAGSDVTVLGEFAHADASLERELQSLRATDAAANLDLAIAQARTANPAVSQIHVVSDTAPLDSSGLAWVPVGARADNAAITAMAARRSARGGTVTLLVAVRNYGAAAAAGEVVVTRNASVLARRTLDLPAAAESSVVFELPDLEGVVVARLAPADALVADNTRYTIVASATPLRALLIGRNYWVEQALAVHPNVATVVAGATLGGDERELDLVICASCADVPSDSPRAGVLLVPPPSESPREASAVVVTNGNHPLLQGLNVDGAFVSPIRGAIPGERAQVLAHAATLPVIVVQELDQRRVVELRIDPSASGITGEVTFPLFIANAVEWLTAARRRPTMLVAGEPLRLALDDGVGEGSVSGPDGRSVPARRVGNELVVGGTAVAGIYHVNTADGREVDFVVNPAVEGESDLSLVPDSAPLVPAAVDARAPAGITQGLLLTALALLALEWRHRTGERRR